MASEDLDTNRKRDRRKVKVAADSGDKEATQEPGLRGARRPRSKEGGEERSRRLILDVRQSPECRILQDAGSQTLGGETGQDCHGNCPKEY